MPREDGGDYLAAFHTERRGITEAILATSSAPDGNVPYAWLAEALPDDGTVLDVGVGRLQAAQRVVGRWTGSDIGIPLRRLVATKAADRPTR